MVDSSFKGYKITQKEINNSPLLTDFIAKQGFKVSIDHERGLVFISSIKPGGLTKIYENDVQVLDFSQLLNVPLHQIDEIYTERNLLSGDVNAKGGVIRIYRKEGR